MANQVRPTIFKERYFNGTHNYFFEVKVAHNGSKYIVLDQKKKSKGDPKNWETVKLRIFEDELLEFQRVFGKMVDIAFNYMPEKTITATTSTQKVETSANQFLPPVLQELQITNDWKVFEDSSYILLKYLGFQNAYKFSNNSQAGQADGFFRFNNLAVMYDCTIQPNGIEERKKDQLINYCNRLQSGRVELPGNVVEEFQHANKQVWIITKGESKFLKFVNGIAIKIIGIQSLLDIFEQRLISPMSANELEMRLAQL